MCKNSADGFLLNRTAKRIKAKNSFQSIENLFRRIDFFVFNWANWSWWSCSVTKVYLITVIIIVIVIEIGTNQHIKVSVSLFQLDLIERYYSLFALVSICFRFF